MCKELLKIVALAVSLLSDMGPANASLVTWHLQNVSFEDGGTATGYFVYNTAGHAPFDPNNLLETLDVKVSAGKTSLVGGPLFEPFEYSCTRCYLFSGAFGGKNFFFDDARTASGARRVLELLFSRPLPDKGGTVGIDTTGASSYDVSEVYVGGTFPDSQYRAIVSGQVTAFPEPAQIFLLLLGLSALVTRMACGRSISIKASPAA